MELEIGLIISQILAFLIMLWVLKKFAWKRLLKTLQARKDKIQSEFEAINEEKQEIERLMALYNNKIDHIEEEAKKKIAEALELGHKLAQKIQEDAQNEAKAILAKAQKDIANEITKAYANLKEQLVDSVIQTTQKILFEKMDLEKDRKLIGDFIERFEESIVKETN